MVEIWLTSLGSSLHARRRAQTVNLAQRLVRQPSLSGDEGAIAEIVQQELSGLGLDTVWRDEVGNVLACLGSGNGPSVMLNAHMDIVDPGDPLAWRYGPYSGELVDGEIWGRGAVDDKGCLAAQISAVGLLCREGLIPPGEILLAAVVHEEDGGLGTRFLTETVRCNRAVVGEPSGNTLRRGHRGRFEFVITLKGRSVHASVPDRGLNPHFSMARFLTALEKQPMFREPVFGGSTVAPTLSYVDQTSSNVIPAEVTVHLDWRPAPGETLDQARSVLVTLLRQSIAPGIEIDLGLRRRSLMAYTGYQRDVTLDLPSFCLETGDPYLLEAQKVAGAVLGRHVPIDVWLFGTDGGYLYHAGTPCIGFGPGNEHMAHVVDEHLAVEELVQATARVYMALAWSLAGGS